MTGSSARVASINHNACYHKLHTVSNTIIVLVFSEMTSFVRMILQREENKGVELTVWRENGLGGQAIDLENGRQGHQFDDDGSSDFSTIVAGPAQFHFSGNRVNQAPSIKLGFH